MTATYTEIDGPDGRKLAPVEGTQAVTLAGVSIVLADGCLAGLLTSSGYLDDLEQTVIEELEKQTFPTIPLPDAGRTEEATWGYLKTIFTE